MSGTKSQKSTSKGNKVIKHLSAAKVAEEHKALEYFITRLQEYEVVYSNDGNYYDLVDGKPHPRNEMACMFRWDYINNKVGSLTGKDLHKAIERFLLSAEEAFRKQFENPDQSEYVAAQTDFMKRFTLPSDKK